MKRYGVYVDGFNLYNRCLKGTPHKWLDLRALFQNLKFEDGSLELIRYFTARLTPRSNDLDIHVRQNVYLRALATIPQLSIHFGHFKPREVKGELLDQNGRSRNQIVTVKKFEEKGSDVNLASHMLADAFLNRYDAAILITSDSDIAGTLDLIKEHTRKPVGLVPTSAIPTIELEKRAVFRRKITPEILSASQFPDELHDAKGKFHKPRSWA